MQWEFVHESECERGHGTWEKLDDGKGKRGAVSLDHTKAC